MKTPQVAPLAGMSVLGFRLTPRPAGTMTPAFVPAPTPAYLLAPLSCINGECGPECAERVKEDTASGRFFITMGHAGYNSPANNRQGYASKKAALKASQGYGERGRRRGIASGSVLLCTKCEAICHGPNHCQGSPARALTSDEAARFIAGGRHALGVRPGFGAR